MPKDTTPPSFLERATQSLVSRVKNWVGESDAARWNRAHPLPSFPPPHQKSLDQLVAQRETLSTELRKLEFDIEDPRTMLESYLNRSFAKAKHADTVRHALRQLPEDPDAGECLAAIQRIENKPINELYEKITPTAIKAVSAANRAIEATGVVIKAADSQASLVLAHELTYFNQLQARFRQAIAHAQSPHASPAEKMYAISVAEMITNSAERLTQLGANEATQALESISTPLHRTKYNATLAGETVTPTTVAAAQVRQDAETAKGYQSSGKGTFDALKWALELKSYLDNSPHTTQAGRLESFYRFSDYKPNKTSGYKAQMEENRSTSNTVTATQEKGQEVKPSSKP